MASLLGTLMRVLACETLPFERGRLPFYRGLGVRQRSGALSLTCHGVNQGPCGPVVASTAFPACPQAGRALPAPCWARALWNNLGRTLSESVGPNNYPASWGMEPMDLLTEHGPQDGGSPSLPFEPEALTNLLEFAKELLMLEVGGPDRGGNTTFAQRRRGASLKDAFALSCLLVFEGAVGPKSARQRQFYSTSALSTFEHFVSLAHEWAVGPGVPRSWALGPDPIRKAIATRVAWLKLFKVAGCSDAESFNTLPAEAQEAAVRKLRPQERRRLIPAAAPLI